MLVEIEGEGFCAGGVGIYLQEGNSYPPSRSPSSSDILVYDR